MKKIYTMWLGKISKSSFRKERAMSHAKIRAHVFLYFTLIFTCGFRGVTSSIKPVLEILFSKSVYVLSVT